MNIYLNIKVLSLNKSRVLHISNTTYLKHIYNMNFLSFVCIFYILYYLLLYFSLQFYMKPPAANTSLGPKAACAFANFAALAVFAA